MLIGSFIWGYVADSKGRKFTLIICMLMDGFFNILSSVSQIYPIFILCRLLSGFGYIKYIIIQFKNIFNFYIDLSLNDCYRISGSTTLFSYLVEFLHIKYREKFLSWMEMFWTIGIILLPCKNLLIIIDGIIKIVVLQL